MINKIKKNLLKSSSYFSSLVARKKRDLEIFSGDFWSDSVIEDTDRKGRICKSFTQYPKYVNAIVSPMSKSPYHADIEDTDGLYQNVQAGLDKIENDNNAKYVILQAARHACIQGVGFWIMSTIDGKIIPEAVRDVSQVALDPNVQELDCKDAEWGAVVNFISITKAKRLYGDDVVYSDKTSILSNFGEQWETPADSVAIVTYYELNESGAVDMYKACGNKIIQDKMVINISRIPIFRICFNEVVRNNKIDYTGIVDMTSDLQFGINIGYSTLLERANRTPKANFMMPAKAIDGLEEYYKKLHTKESLVALYNGDVAPTPMVENYQTADLMQTIQICNDLMSTTIGVPSQGINPAMNNQTATEILIQQNNSESNVNCLYENAFNAIFEFNKTVIELLCWQENIDRIPTFKLINGPTIITKLQKRRQELLAVSSLVDEKTRKLIAKEYIDTLDADVKENLTADLIANSPEINWVSDMEQKADPYAVNIMNQYQEVLTQTQDELEAQVAANAQLKNEIANLQLQLMNQKESLMAEMVKHNDQVQLEQMKLQLEAQKANADISTGIQEASIKNEIENTKLQKAMLDVEKEKMKMIQEAMSNG